MKKKMFILTASLFFLLFFTASPGFAAFFNIDEVIDHQITGGEMDGLRVTVGFSDGSEASVLWSATGSDSGNAIGTGFILSQSGDTYGKPWSLFNFSTSPNLNIQYLTLEGLYEGGSSNIVFDIIDLANNTPGSYYGRLEASGAGVSTTEKVYYQGTFYDDLYAKVTFDFCEDVLSPGETFSFLLDTDKVKMAPVPEPGTLLLMGSGLLSLAGIRRSRRKNIH
ncbi:MAG: PEP-CTERM sorting domain-containing protein [Deltaproteobacteria bacterium]|nr:PEP-CTERM sorting domain-containing protein [Deltaproteobacteria bacterium]